MSSSTLEIQTKNMFRLIIRTLILMTATTSIFLLYLRHNYYIPATLQTDPLPHTKELISQNRYLDAQKYLEYFMQFEYIQHDQVAKALLKDIKKERASLKYKALKIVNGITTGTSDELNGQISAIGSDFLLIGDIRDIFIEGDNFLRGKEVDQTLLVLSSIGLAASASTLFTAGGTAVPKIAISILKLSKKSKLMPKWIRKQLNRDSRIIIRSKNIKSVEPILNNIEAMYKNMGLVGTMKLLSKTHNPKELTQFAKYSKQFGKHTDTLLDLNKGSVLRYLPSMHKIKPKSIMLASTYGENGLKGLSKVGEKRFLKSISIYKGFSKSGYKGLIKKIILKMLKLLSDTTLWMILATSLLILVPLKKQAP